MILLRFEREMTALSSMMSMAMSMMTPTWDMMRMELYNLNRMPQEMLHKWWDSCVPIAGQCAKEFLLFRSISRYVKEQVEAEEDSSQEAKGRRGGMLWKNLRNATFVISHLSLTALWIIT